MMDSIENEYGVIGSLILDERTIPLVREVLTPEDFSMEVNQEIFRVACALCDAGQPADFLTIFDAVQRRGTVTCERQYFLQLMEITPTAANIRAYIALVKADSDRRKLLTLAQKVQQAALSHADPQALLTAIQKGVDGIQAGQQVQEDLSTLENAMTGFLAYRKRIDEGEVVTTSTGYPDLDRCFGGGFLRGGFYLAAGRPGMGKTTFGLNVALRAAKRGVPVLFVTLEMTQRQVTAKLLSIEGGLPVGAVLNEPLSGEDDERLTGAMMAMQKLPIHINRHTGASVEDIRRLAYGVKGLGLVVVDYVGLLRPDNPKVPRYEAVSQISRDLKELALRLDVPLLGLCQLNRQNETRKTPRPILSDLRDSGELEQDADGILLLHRPDYYDSNYPHQSENPVLLETIVAKSRYAAGKTVHLDFYLRNGRIA